MKLVPHPDFPLLGKWIPSLQQEEKPPDDIDYKEMDAADFHEICIYIDPTDEDNRKLDEKYNAALSLSRLSSAPVPFRHPSGYDEVFCHIKKLDLEEYITLQSISNSHSGRCEITGVVFRNLKIKGNVEINSPTLEKIEFENSEFLDHVSIAAKGTPDAMFIFTGNKFSKSFTLTVANAQVVVILRNRISYTMDMCYGFTSRLLTFSGPEKPPRENLRHELLITFSENKISNLTIRDIDDASDWNERGSEHSLKETAFEGDNHIGDLVINTKHTALTTRAKLKSDINRISFSASDKIGAPSTKTGSIFYNEAQLTYGRFFSLLEVQASKQHDRVTEEMYKRKARYFYRKFLPHRKDRFIFGWTNLISKDGTSWIHPIFWLTGTEALLTGIAYYFLFGCDLTYFIEEGWQILLTLFSWFMNPASLLPLPPLPLDKETIAKAWQIYPLFFFQKLFAVVFYYEAVKALRRFTR